MNIEKFRADHVSMLGSVNELRRLVHAGIADNAAAIASMVISISATIKLHLAAEDRVLYPSLKSSNNTQAIQIAEKYQTEMGTIAAAYREFSREWNLGSKIAAEPEAFRKAADHIFKALYERIKREDRELYPLADLI